MSAGARRTVLSLALSLATACASGTSSEEQPPEELPGEEQPEGQPPTGPSAPLPIIDANIPGGRAPLTVRFSGGRSTDPDGDLIQLGWDFGDGSPQANGAEVTHTFQQPGLYQVVLAGVDLLGQVGVASLTINVLDSTNAFDAAGYVPTAVLSTDRRAGEAPLTVRFDASASSDVDGDLAAYEWYFDDGSPVESGASVVHSFTTPGTFQVVLTVSDAAGHYATSTVLIEALVSLPCPSFVRPVSAGRVNTNALPEISGMVASRRTPGILWAHNDSGDGGRLYALDAHGVLLRTYQLRGVYADDWEDIAIGPGPDPSTDYLYVGDIGDNSQTAGLAIVYRVAEPQVSGASSSVISLSSVEAFQLRYPGGRSHNTEAMFVDPQSGDLVLITKSEDGNSTFFRAPSPLSALSPNQLIEEGKIDFSIPGYSGTGLVTAADISASGDQILIRTYNQGFLWPRGPGEEVMQAFLRGACDAPIPQEPQGESITFAHDASGYYTISEGVGVNLFFVGVAP